MKEILGQEYQQEMTTDVINANNLDILQNNAQQKKDFKPSPINKASKNRQENSYLYSE